MPETATIETLAKEAAAAIERLALAARDAEDERRILALWTEAASMRRATAVADLYEYIETQEGVAELLGIGQARVCALLSKARRAADLEDFDVVEVTESNPGYEPDQAGRLAVQQDGEWVAWAVDMEEAAAFISSKVGTVVKLVNVEHYDAGQRWEPAPAG